MKTDISCQVFLSVTLTSDLIFRAKKRHWGQPFLEEKALPFLNTMASAKGEEYILGAWHGPEEDGPVRQEMSD